MSIAPAAIRTRRRLRSAHSIILLSTCDLLSRLVSVCACFGRLEFLEFQLIGALRYNALTFVQTRKYRNLAAQFITNCYFTTFKLFTRQQNVNDLLSLVLKHGFFGNHHCCDLFPSLEANIGLHSQTQSTSVVWQLK